MAEMEKDDEEEKAKDSQPRLRLLGFRALVPRDLGLFQGSAEGTSNP